ncbi:hypothetical protein BJ165DRAFT_368657 [Panaeolus papilionaceus]|nr:hypothetical protein BJ165DRAFT_368657 [Panaeolus papilionaceus]
MKIVKMIQDWMKKANLYDFGADRILYFDRITDIRMSGSKQRRMNMFKALTGKDTAPNITIVTTMWDQLWNETQLNKADDRMEQLRKDHWKDFVFAGSQIVQFENTQKSAFHVLNKCLGKAVYNPNLWFGFEFEYDTVWDADFGPLLHQDLLDRKLQLRQKLEFMREDMKQKSTKANPILKAQLRKEISEVERDLKKVEKELKEFGTPPPPDLEIEDVDSSRNSEEVADLTSESSTQANVYDHTEQTLDLMKTTAILSSSRSPSPMLSIHREDVLDMFHRTKQRMKGILHISSKVSNS